MKFYYILSLPFFLTATVNAEDLAHFYLLAKQSNPAFKMSLLDRQIKDNQTKQIQTGWRPALAFNTTYNQTWSSANNPNNSLYRYGLSLTQALYNPVLDINLTQSELNREKSIHNHDVVTQSLMLQVTDSYFSVLKALNNVEFSKNNQITVEQQLLQSQKMFELGVSAITDMHDAEARYDLAVSEQILSDNQLQISLENLRELVGKYEKAPQLFTGDLQLTLPEPNDIDQWTDKALEQALSLQISQIQTNITQKEIHKRRRLHLPNINLQLNHSYSKTDLTGNGLSQNTAALVLNMPLDISGNIRTRTEEARLLHQQSLELLEQQKRQVKQQAREAYLNVISSIGQVKALRKAMRSSQTAYKSTKTSFDVGSRTVVDVLNAKRSVLQTKRDVAAAGYDYLLNTLRLKQAVSSLTEQDLIHISQAYTDLKKGK